MPQIITEENITITPETYVRFPRVKALFKRIDEYLSTPAAEKSQNYEDDILYGHKWKDIDLEHQSLRRTLTDLVFYYGSSTKNPPPFPPGYARMRAEDLTPYQEFLYVALFSGDRSFFFSGYQQMKPLIVEAMDKYENDRAAVLNAALAAPIVNLTGEDLLLLLQEYARRERLLKQ